MTKSRFLISGLVMAGITPVMAQAGQQSNAAPPAADPDPSEDALIQRFAQEHLFTLAQHRSHSSHSSHGSHRSGASGTPRPAPRAAPPPRIPRATPAPTPRSTRNQSSTPPSAILPSSPATAPQQLLSPQGTTDPPSASEIQDLVRRVQVSLMALGYYQGAIDGIVGPQTRSALERYQRDYGLQVTGTITPEVLDAFRLSLD